MNAKFYRITPYTWNFQNFNSVYNHNSCEIWHSFIFLGLPWEISFGVTTGDLLHLKPLKNLKKNAIFFKLF